MLSLSLSLSLSHTHTHTHTHKTVHGCHTVLIFSLTAEDDEHEMVRKPFVPQIGRMMIAVPHGCLLNSLEPCISSWLLHFQSVVTVVLAIGLQLMVMIYTFGHVSGHFNPYSAAILER